MRYAPPVEYGENPFREGGAYRVAVAYPAPWRTGGKNLGHFTVFRLLNTATPPAASRGGRLVTAERVFMLPDRPAAAPSLETGRPLQQFDVVAFSVSWELDLPALVDMLESASIPALRSSRRPELHPLVVAGGAAVTLNHRPLAPFVDAIYLGEAEAGLADFTTGLVSLLESGEYGCELERPVIFDARRLSPPVPDAWSLLVNDSPPFASAALVEVERGCRGACAFCAASRLYRPRRELPAHLFRSLCGRAVALCGRVGLVGADFGDRDSLLDLLDTVRAAGAQATVSSIRADLLVPEVARSVAAHGQRTVTVGVESLSRRILEFLGKRWVDPAAFPEALSAFLAAGVERVKLYMMMGVPGEEEEDLLAAAHVLRRLPPGLAHRVELSCSVFQPKPLTPLQEATVIDRRTYRTRRRLLERMASKLGLRIRVAGWKETVAADWLGRGDESSLVEYLERGRRLPPGAASAVAGRWRRILAQERGRKGSIRPCETVRPTERMQERRNDS